MLLITLNMIYYYQIYQMINTIIINILVIYLINVN